MEQRHFWRGDASKRWRCPKRTCSQRDHISCRKNLQMEDDKDKICINGDSGYITSDIYSEMSIKGFVKSIVDSSHRDAHVLAGSIIRSLLIDPGLQNTSINTCAQKQTSWTHRCAAPVCICSASRSAPSSPRRSAGPPVSGQSRGERI